VSITSSPSPSSPIATRRRQIEVTETLSNHQQDFCERSVQALAIAPGFPRRRRIIECAALLKQEAATTTTIERPVFATETKSSDLEIDPVNAAHMAHVAVTMLERVSEHKPDQVSLTGRPVSYHVDSDELDVLLYALYETRCLIRDARDLYCGTPDDDAPERARDPDRVTFSD